MSDNLLVFFRACFALNNLLYDTTAILVEAELAELGGDALHEKAYVVAAHTELDQPLDNVVSVLVHDHVYDRAVFELGD